jgi:predicted branched-subunit amino acid permease
MVTSQAVAEGRRPAEVRRFYAGASVTLATGWSSLVGVGAVAGNLVPPGSGLELLAPLSLVAMVVPRLRSWPGLACGVAAMTVAVAGAGLPAGLSALLAMPAGVLAARLFERPVSSRSEEVSR